MNLTKKIQPEEKLTEKTYRAMKNISYSDLKLFEDDRSRFYQEKILGTVYDKKDTLATIIGSLVHTLILEKSEFDNKYALAPVVVTGQMGILAENLYKRTVKCMSEDGTVTTSIQVLMEQAINDTRYNGKGEEVAFKGKSFEKVVEMFSGSDAETLYNYMRANHDKMVVTLHNIEKAELIAKEMMENPWLDGWINVTSKSGVDVYNEYPVIWTDGMEHKSKIDRFVVNHDHKTVQPMDIKSTYDSENFEYSYLYRGYYLQCAMYDKALKAWCKQEGYDNYQINPMVFLVCDSMGFMRSQLYKVSRYDLKCAYDGFITKNGREYKGLTESLQDLQYCLDTGIWNTTRTAIEKQGINELHVEYQ